MGDNPTMPDEKPTCFVAMPLTTPADVLPLYDGDADHFIHVLDYLFAPAVALSGYLLVRPIMQGADLIQAEIVRNLEIADLVLCDVSRHNPNVFFELGIRTALDRPVALVRDSRTERLPFDTGILNTHTYEASLAPWRLDDEVKTLANHLQLSVERANGRNPLWQYFGLTRRAEPGTEQPEDPVQAKLDLVLSELRTRSPGKAPSSVASTRPITTRSTRPKGEPLPTSRSSGTLPDGLPAGMERLLLDLADIAWDEVYASLWLVEVTDRHIVLDAGPFLLSHSVWRTMAERAEQDGYSVMVRTDERSYGDDSPVS